MIRLGASSCLDLWLSEYRATFSSAEQAIGQLPIREEPTMAQSNITKAAVKAEGLLYSPEGRRAPWHVMGGDLTKGHASLAEGLAATGLDYEVTMRPLYGVDAAGNPILATNLRTVVRPMADGTEKVLAATGTRFTPIQNRDAFSVADYLVGEFGAKITGLTDFHGGGASLLVLQMPEGVTVEGRKGVKDHVELNLLAKNAHDGSSALTFALTGLRPTCTNALPAAIRDAKRTWKISHTPNAGDRVELAKQAIIASLNYRDAFAAQASELLSTPMVDAEFGKIVSSLWNVKDDARETKAGQNRLAIQEQVKALYHSSKTLDGIRGTRWAGYNAITEWMDWGRPVKGGDVARAEGSLAMDGHPVTRQKVRVWEVFAGV